MPLPQKGKLVRDLIPEIISSSGKVPVTCQVSGDDLHEALKLKAREEVDELYEADSTELLEEIADVYEVLISLVKNQNRDWSEIEEIARLKRIKRGGFSHGHWLIDTRDESL
jgi:predicted house-cleaning noncanonical NTP pyrophosphatase (MazG superfamily)